MSALVEEVQGTAEPTSASIEATICDTDNDEVSNEMYRTNAQLKELKDLIVTSLSCCG